MAGVRISFKLDGFKQLRSAPKVVADLEARAKRVQSEAQSLDGGTYKLYSQQGKENPQGRWRTSVTTGDVRTIKLNSKNNTLLRALDAAR